MPRSLLLLLSLVCNGGDAFQIPTVVEGAPFSLIKLSGADDSTSTSRGLFFRPHGASGLTRSSSVLWVAATSQDGDGSLFGGPFTTSQQQQPKQLFEIPVQAIKTQALRFFLQLYLVGERQNNPVPGAWLIRQGDDVNGDSSKRSIQVYYQDGTAMLSLELSETAIVVVRHGAKPSLQYMLQESMLLHDILDQLADVASGITTADVKDDSSNSVEVVVPIEQRLVVLSPIDGDTGLDAINQARETLPARKA